MKKIVLFIIFLINPILDSFSQGLLINEINENVISIIENYYSRKNSLLITIEFSFNEQGKLNSQIFSSEQINLNTIYLYNSEGKLIEEHLESQYGNSKTIYQELLANIDTFINYISEEDISASGKVYYDNDKNIIKRISCSKNNDTLCVDESKYDETGNLLHRKFISYQSNIESTFHNYNYNEKNITNLYVVLDKDGNEKTYESYEYEFDSFHNWIVKKVFNKNNELIKTITREIKYK